ncbi:hypothetical protein KSP39_PZI024008 [Platanthera zijinensis]|uniref:Uncharacterized protein n=1 Tax=Platanthera zijinensis TaxID=2320716 RepID=A0AAP0FS68_9ASPA
MGEILEGEMCGMTLSEPKNGNAQHLRVVSVSPLRTGLEEKGEQGRRRGDPAAGGAPEHRISIRDRILDGKSEAKLFNRLLLHDGRAKICEGNDPLHRACVVALLPLHGEIPLSRVSVEERNPFGDPWGLTSRRTRKAWAESHCRHDVALEGKSFREKGEQGRRRGDPAAGGAPEHRISIRDRILDGKSEAKLFNRLLLHDGRAKICEGNDPLHRACVVALLPLHGEIPLSRVSVEERNPFG